MMKNKSGILSFFLSIFITLSFILTPLRAQDASLLPNAVQQFFDNNGNPLSSGKVYFYEVGTSTFKSIYTSTAATTPYTNPITLNAAGRPPSTSGGNFGIYGIGTYRQVVKDKLGNTIWDAVTAPGGGGSTPTDVGDGNQVGTVLPWAGLVAPNQYVFTYGQELSRTTYPELYTAITQQLNVICSSASNVLTGLSDTSQVRIGSPVELALCVSPGTTVTAKTAATITLSNPSSVSINSVARFFPWGNGDGSTTFNVPDYRGVVMAGRTNMGGSASSNLTSAACPTISPDSLGASCGAQTSTLVQANLPNVTLTTTIAAGQGSHFHAMGIGGSNTTGGGGTNGPINTANNTSAATLPAMTGTTPLSGSNLAFSNIQPTITINYVIKVTPDTSTSIATGVYSIGGMTGVISCGTGILCTGNIISFNSSSFAGGSNTNIQYNNNGELQGSANYAFISPDTVTLGNAGITGKFQLKGSTSGTVTQSASAVAGTPTITWGNTSGTPAVTATVPAVINSTTGNLTIMSGAPVSGGIPYFSSTSVMASTAILSANQLILGGGAGSPPASFNCATTTTVLHGGTPPTCGQIVSADITTNTITNSNLSQTGAATLKGNPTAALANVQDFTLSGLTQTISPNATDWMLIFDNSTGTFKKINATSIASSATAGVSSLNGLTGVVSVTGSGTNTISASGLTVDINNWGDPNSITNCSITASVAGNALTVALKGKNGSDPSATNPCYISFRNDVISNGNYSLVTVSSATSFTTGTSGSTFGTSSSNVPFRLWVTALNNSGTVLLGVSTQSISTQVFSLSESALNSTTACSACTNATSAGTIYTTSALTSKATRILGYLEWGSGLATAGTWASVPTKIQNMTQGIKKPGEVVQSIAPITVTSDANCGNGSFSTTNVTQAITPTSATNLIRYYAIGTLTINSGAVQNQVQMFRASTAIGANLLNQAANGVDKRTVTMLGMDNPATTSSTTYAVKCQQASATVSTFPSTGGGLIILEEIQG